MIDVLILFSQIWKRRRSLTGRSTWRRRGPPPSPTPPSNMWALSLIFTFNPLNMAWKIRNPLTTCWRASDRALRRYRSFFLTDIWGFCSCFGGNLRTRLTSCFTYRGHHQTFWFPNIREGLATSAQLWNAAFQWSREFSLLIPAC